MNAKKKIAKKASRRAETARKREETRKFLEQLPEEEQAKLREEARLKREASQFVSSLSAEADQQDFHHARFLSMYIH